MQIKHINPFHLVGAGIKHCKKAKQTKGFFFRPNPVHTLKSPMTCLFCWDFENICKVFWCRPKDRKIEGCQSNFASSLVCWINCKNPCWCIPSLNVLSRLWKSINWVMFSSIWTISTIWYCIIVQHHPMQYHIRAHMMKCWDATLKSCNTTYHKMAHDIVTYQNH